MSQQLQILLGVVAIIGAISGFLKWHFNEMHKLKDSIQELKLEVSNTAKKVEVESLKLQMKDLEKKDELQQLTLDQLPTLLPLINKLINEKSTRK